MRALHRFSDYIIITFILPFWLLLAGCSESLPSQRSVRVGVYRNEPLTLINTNGQVTGFYIDLLQYIARRENWSIAYIPCTFADCLNQLQSGNIDILVAVAYTPERDQLFDFSQVTVLENWGQVYTQLGSSISRLVDLDGKTIAVLKGDTYYDGLDDALKESNITPFYLEQVDFASVLQEVSAGNAEAGIVSRLFGIKNEVNYRVNRSPIVCCLRQLRFAVSPGKNSDLVSAIDRNMIHLINDPNSLYYSSYQNWILGEEPAHISPVFLWIFVSAAAVVLLLITINLFLRRQVQLRTAELRAKNEQLAHEIDDRREANRALDENQRRLSLLLSNLPGMAFRSRNDERLTLEFVSQGCTELTGYPPDVFLTQLNGDITSIIHTEDQFPVLSELRTAIQEHRPYQVTYRLINAEGKQKWVWEQGRAVYDDYDHFLGIEGFVIDINERIKAENIRSVLYNITTASQTGQSLEEMLATIHHELGRLMDNSNFYLALYDPTTDLYTFPYDVDEKDHNVFTAPQRLDGTLTDYVRRRGVPMLISAEKDMELIGLGEVQLIGTPAAIWMGAPLHSTQGVLGVIALQHYTDPKCYTPEDLQTLTIVSETIAKVIESKRTAVEIAWLAEVANQASEAIVIAEMTGRILYVNNYFEQMTGYSRTELVGKKRFKNRGLILSPSEHSRIMEQIHHGSTWRGVVHCQCKNGKIISEETLIFPIRNSNGVIINFASISHDITAESRHQAALEAFVGVVTALRSAQNRAEIIDTICKQVNYILEAEGSMVVLFEKNDPNSSLRVAGACGEWETLVGESIHINPNIEQNVTQSTVLIHHQKDDVYSFNPAWPAEFHQMTSLIFSPLQTQGKIIGALWAGSHQKFDDQVISLMETISDIAANSIYRSTLSEQTDLRLRRLACLRSIDLTISSSLDLRFTLNVLLGQVVTQLQVDAAAILQYNPSTGILEYVAGVGLRGESLQLAHFRVGEGPEGQVVLNRQKIYLADIQDEQWNHWGYTFPDEGFTAMYAVPLIAKGQVNGVLDLFLRSPNNPDLEWSDFLDALALQAAIAINNTELFENLQRSNYELTYAYDETLEGWVRALDIRDKETEGHTQRVTDLMEKLARALGISEADMIHVRRGALLHDIGKMGISDTILRKPGPLDSEEWVVMRRHPEYAYQLLYPIKYLRQALDIPYYHHEHWDGSGYPQGLRGEEIPLAARIFAVIDVWDALLSDRPYRPAWKRADALEYIRSQSGKQFDPKIVETFLQIIESESLTPHAPSP